MAQPALDPDHLLAALGISGHAPPEPLAGGMSRARLWRVRNIPGVGDLVLRALPDSAMARVEREAATQRVAGEHSIPVAPIHHVAQIDGTPVMLMGLMPGVTVADRLNSHPDEAAALGRASGEMLARIHHIPAEAMPPDPEQRWAHWNGAIDPELSRRLLAAGTARSPLHFDFQPTNLLAQDGRIVAVLDWTNAGIGEPRADLGRARASLEVGAILHDRRDVVPIIETYWSALLDGYASIGGRTDTLDLFVVASLDALIDDFTRNLNGPFRKPVLAKMARRRSTLARRAGLPTSWR